MYNNKLSIINFLRLYLAQIFYIVSTIEAVEM